MKAHNKKPSLAELKEYARTQSWQYQMDNSKGLDSHSNYSGGMEYPHFVVSVGRNRDSELLDESNFDVALAMLGGESKTVKVERFGHWGCCWFELILVDPKDRKALRTAYDIHVRLKEYPVLDDSDFLEREYEYQSEFASEHAADTSKALAEHFDLTDGKALRVIAYQLQMSCQSFYGNDACLDIYSGRTPDKRSIEHLKNCVRQCEYDFKTSRVFKKLQLAVNAFQPKE